MGGDEFRYHHRRSNQREEISGEQKEERKIFLRQEIKKERQTERDVSRVSLSLLPRNPNNNNTYPTLSNIPRNTYLPYTQRTTTVTDCVADVRSIHRTYTHYSPIYISRLSLSPERT